MFEEEQDFWWRSSDESEIIFNLGVDMLIILEEHEFHHEGHYRWIEIYSMCEQAWAIHEELA